MDKEALDMAQTGRVYTSQIVEITTDSRDDEPEVVAFTKAPRRSAGSGVPPTDVAG
jgi:hypothetical protein